VVTDSQPSTAPILITMHDPPHPPQKKYNTSYRIEEMHLEKE
jgi:hypothetical protein